MGKAVLKAIEITDKDLELIESAIIKISGSGFGFGANRMRINTLAGIWELTDELRCLADRMREALENAGDN